MNIVYIYIGLWLKRGFTCQRYWYVLNTSVFIKQCVQLVYLIYGIPWFVPLADLKYIFPVWLLHSGILPYEIVHGIGVKGSVGNKATHGSIY